MTTRSIITIGNFDGVHLGHAALVRCAREVARTSGARVVVLAFDPHPAAVLRPGSEPAQLTMWARRAELLREIGADDVVKLEPGPELLGKSPAEFVAWLQKEFAPLAIVEGPDFRFGRGRSGDVTVLAELGREAGFTVEIVKAVEARLSDESVVPVSSTLARLLISHGRMQDAAAVLGRAYEVEGVVVRGDRRGRSIGYPTANLRTECLLPADGVYAGVGVLPDGAGGRRVAAAISVGDKPTFGGSERTIEAYLMGTDMSHGQATAPGQDVSAWEPLPGLPEYDWPLRLEVGHWLRDQAKYGSLEGLLKQMQRDCERTFELVEGEMSRSAGKVRTR